MLPSFLRQDGKEIQSFSTMCKSNGQWHLPLPECHSMFTFKRNGNKTLLHSTTNEVFCISLQNINTSFCCCCCFSAVIDCGEPKPLLNGGVTFLSGYQNQYQSIVQYHCNAPFYSLLGSENGEIFIYSAL